MSESLDSEFYSNNRARLRTLFKGTAPIVITANGQLQQGGDATYRFHQDSSFLYLTGINQPDIVLVMEKDKEYLILPERSEYSVLFDGAHFMADFIEASGISEILENKVGWKKLGARLKKVKHFATLAPLPAYLDSHDFYTNPARATLLTRVKELNPEIEPLDLRQHLGVMRMVKQKPEIDAIQSAIDVTVETLKQIRRKLPKLEQEYQVEALLSAGFRSQGTEGHSFDPIVASGKNTCVFHYNTNNQPLSKNGFLLLDVGAQVSRYAADISRTYKLVETVTRRQQQVYDAVCAVQDFAFDYLKPGVTLREYEKAVEHFMGEKLRSLGLIKNVERDEIRRFFPHATSHFLGLDVHDGGDYDRPLQPGVVLTVEPGIYVPDEEIGVRIEDDVLITEDGIDILSKKLPREL